MVDAVSKGFDRAGWEASALMVDALSSLAILLVINLEGGTCGLKQGVQWSCVGDDVTSVGAEGDIPDSELFGPALLVVPSESVFTNPQKIVEGNVN